ncbi:Pex12 amino terminal region-domain-containing protein [Catenaria anguillulae PL171]|uniref:RING-type E3 ubiquitin transferase (cysteine targeting) n=1 Tax=Catenaria anguillulae PL171 TaxID=765915 RepID=A0A1Y2HEZ8_9FUNG|nr:Pex12 amino terminal region-domain-containing protein [Catenaria anguillulae PL171]
MSTNIPDTNPVAIPRVGQLDADQLDTQIHHLLKDQLANAMSLLPRRDWISRYDPEISAALHAILLGLSLFRTRGSGTAATYGMYLNQFTYRGARGKLWLFALLSVGTPYAWTRLIRKLSDERWADMPGWRSMLARVAATRIEPLWNSLVLLNLLRFLVTGRYPTPLHRLLKLQPLPTRPSTQRNVSFAFLHRQVMWAALTEAILFALPLYHSARPLVRRWIRGSPKLAALWDVVSGGSAKMKQARALLLLPADVCGRPG